MFRRRLIPIVVLVLVALALSTYAPSQAQSKTTITFLACGCWGGDITQVAKDFEADNPDISVNVEKPAFDQMFQQIQVQLGGGQATPDVFAVDVPVTASYSYRGWLMPLDDVFTETDKADWLPAAVKAGSYKSKLMSAPLSTSTQLLYYNKKLFDAAGITPPGIDERWTWEKIAEVAPKLTQAQNGQTTVWGFNWEQTNRIYQLQVLPVSLGGQAIGDDGLTVKGVINSKPWIDAFTYYYNMFNVLKAAPQDINFQSGDAFQAGKLAMFVGGPWWIPTFSKAKLDFEWGVSRHPYFANGKIVTPTGSWHIGINANTKNKDAAAKFVHWISTGKGAEDYWRKGPGDFPAQQSILAKFQTDPEFQTGGLAFLKTAANEATVNPVPRPTTVGYLEYEQILADTFQDIRTGTKPEDALNSAVDRIESEMAKYRK